MTPPNLLDTIHPALRTIPPVETVRIDESLHRLQWNESPIPFPPDLKQEVLQRLERMDWARYPVTLRPWDLIGAIAHHLDVAESRVVVSSGSSDMIRLVLGVLVGPGDAVVMPSPTFLLYRRNARLLSADIHECSCSPELDFALPVDDLIVTAQTNQASAVVLCAPNNPTGTVFSEADLTLLAEECGCPLVIDEAYVDFCEQDLLAMALAHENVILIRTLSKACSMAGVRLGYSIAHPALAAEVQKAVTAFPISIFQDIAARVAIENYGRFTESVARIVAERERLAASLRALPGVTVYSSGANFLLVRPPGSARKVYDHLLNTAHILVSDSGGYPELHNCLRITVGAPEINDQVVQAFSDCL